jgi:hypothetical protein
MTPANFDVLQGANAFEVVIFHRQGDAHGGAIALRLNAHSNDLAQVMALIFGLVEFHGFEFRRWGGCLHEPMIPVKLTLEKGTFGSFWYL